MKEANVLQNIDNEEGHQHKYYRIKSYANTITKQITKSDMQ